MLHYKNKEKLMTRGMPIVTPLFKGGNKNRSKAKVEIKTVPKLKTTTLSV